MWKNILLAALSSLFSLYLLEGLLLVRPYLGAPRRELSLADLAQQQGLPYDRRTPLRVLADEKKQGRDAVLYFGPAFIVAGDGIEVGQGKIFPLSGMTRRNIIRCNEFGEYLISPSDEHGFNNPLGLYHPPLDIALIGDSFTEGACVKPGQDMASRLRAKYPGTLAFGQGGSGALIELALLKEYAEPLRPKAIFWIYYGNDVTDLAAERKSPFLKKYLSGEFSQDLLHRRKAVDEAWRRYFENVGQYPAPEAGRIVENPRFRQRAARFISFYYLRIFTLNAYPLSMEDKAEAALFLQIIDKAKSRVEAWGGRFYFVYLPERNFFVDKKKADRFRGAVISGIKTRHIPLIDVYATFSAQPDPLAFFYLKKSTHYNAGGYALIAEEIAKAFQEGKNVR